MGSLRQCRVCKMYKRAILICVFLSIIFCGLVFAAKFVDVYCPKCLKYLFTLEYESGLTLSDADGHGLICPFDGAPLNGWEYWAWERGMSAPKMVYPALTVWTTDDGDMFYWFPHNVDIAK